MWGFAEDKKGTPLHRAWNFLQETQFSISHKVCLDVTPNMFPANIPPSLQAAEDGFPGSIQKKLSVTLIFCHIFCQSAAASNNPSRHSEVEQVFIWWPVRKFMNLKLLPALYCEIRTSISSYQYTNFPKLSSSHIFGSRVVILWQLSFAWHQTWPLSARLCCCFWWHPTNLLLRWAHSERTHAPRSVQH